MAVDAEVNDNTRVGGAVAPALADRFKDGRARQLGGVCRDQAVLSRPPPVIVPPGMDAEAMAAPPIHWLRPITLVRIGVSSVPEAHSVRPCWLK